MAAAKLNALCEVDTFQFEKKNAQTKSATYTRGGWTFYRGATKKAIM